MSSVTRSSTRSRKPAALRLAGIAAVAAALGGCSAFDNLISSDKVDYRTGSKQTTGLEVPPDLSQLARDPRNRPQSGPVSAAALQQQQQDKPQTAGARAAAPAGAQVALNTAGDVKLERAGEQRWLRSNQTPEQLWPLLRSFWQERGFELVKDQPELGVMETSWAENRAKLPQDMIRSTIGRVFEGLYSTGERDMYRTRVERAPGGGTDIYIAHRGMEEVYTSGMRDQTAWQPRKPDPLLEAEMLSRLMLQLGGKPEAATNLAAAPAATAAPAPRAQPAPGARSRSLSEVPDSLEMNEGFERAWRRVGQSLDRHGFTIEDRDRNQGMFYLRYADPNQVGKEEPNFFQRLFKGEQTQTAKRYRVAVKSQGERSTVMVLDDKGQQQTNEIAKRILNLLMDDLR
jgi:outer membrane protein assembly factor BamC